MVAVSETDYELLREKLRHAIGSVCPRWLGDRRDDLVQAAMIRVMRHERSCEGNGELASSYLWKVAYCVVVDEIRKTQRRQEVPIEDGPQELPSTSGSEDPERRCASLEIAEGISNCLAELVQSRRLAVALYLQGHTVPEAASLLGWNEKRTDNLIYRGLADLRKCLRSKGLNP